ncbi:hypothetical protein Vretimale_2107, partial [Volvox reticuliferus]
NGNTASIGTSSNRLQPPRAHLAVVSHLCHTAAPLPATSATSIRNRRATVTAIAIAGTQLSRGCRAPSSAAYAGKPVHTFRCGRLPVRLLGRRAPVRRAGRSTVAMTVSANLFARIYRIVTSFFNGLVASF